jgi:hypothetical protein
MLGAVCALCFLLELCKLVSYLILHTLFSVASAGICRTRPSPHKRVAKGLSTKEQAGESIGDSSGSAAAAAAEDRLVMMIWIHVGRSSTSSKIGHCNMKALFYL